MIKIETSKGIGDEDILFNEVFALRVIIILLLLGLLGWVYYTTRVSDGATDVSGSSARLKGMLDNYAMQNGFQYGPVRIEDNMTVREVKLVYLYYKTNPSVDRYLDLAVQEICR